MCLYCCEKNTPTQHESYERLLISLLAHMSRSLPSQDADAQCRMQNRPQSCELRPMQDGDAECRMQNQPQSCELHPIRMQMQNAECRSGPKAGCLSTRCRMQDADAGCGIGLKAVSCTRRTNSLGLTDFASCILHPASCTMQKNPFWGRFCFLHPAFCMLHIQSKHFGLGSAFCILHLHSASAFCIFREIRNVESARLEREIFSNTKQL